MAGKKDRQTPQNIPVWIPPTMRGHGMLKRVTTFYGWVKVLIEIHLSDTDRVF